MKIFITICIMDNGVIIETIDCPDNMPIPNVGDTIDVTRKNFGAKLS